MVKMIKINTDLLIIVIGRIIQIFIMMISIRLVTTLLTPSEIGNYYILFALMAFYNLVFMNPIETYINRHLILLKETNNLLNIIFVFLIWCVLVAFISIPISTFIYNKFEYIDNFEISIFLIFIFISLIISSLYQKIIFGLNILGYRKVFMIYFVLTLLVGLVIASLIVMFYKNNAISWLSGLLISEFLFLFIIFKLFIQKDTLNIYYIKDKLTKELLKKILLFSLPIGITTFLMWGQNTAYRLVVDYLYSAEVLGMIAVGLAVSSAVFNAIQSIAMQYFNPIFLKNIHNARKNERTKAWNDMAKKIVPIYILASFFTISMSQVLIKVLLDEKFHDVYIYTILGVGIEFFRVMTNLLINVSQSEYKTHSTIKPYLIGFIISLGLITFVDFGTNYYMIPLVLCIAYSLVYLYMYINMKRILDIKYNISIKLIVLISLPCLSSIFFTLTNNIIQNIGILVLYGFYFIGTVFYIVKKDHNAI